MTQFLIKAGTRYLDPKNPYFGYDWTTGDIVEIRPDGFWKEATWLKKEGFVVVSAPDIKYSDDLVSKYLGSIPNPDFKADSKICPFLRRSKYRIDISEIANEIKLIDVLDKSKIVSPITTYATADKVLIPTKDSPYIISSYDHGSSITGGTVYVDGVGSGADEYVSLSAFEADIDGDIGNWTGPITCEINTAFTDSTDCTFSGYSPTAEKYILVTATGEARSNGVFGNGYILTGALYLNEGFVAVEGFEVNNGNSNISAIDCSNADVNGDKIAAINMLIHDGSNFGIYLNSGYTRLYIIGSMIAQDGGGIDDDCIKIGAGEKHCWLYHDTLEGGADDGFDSDASTGDLVVFNSVSFNNASNDYEEGSLSATQTEAWSEDGTGSDQLSGSLSDHFTDYTSHDYSLVSTGDLVGAGAAISGLSTSMFGKTIYEWLQTDIKGQTRSGSSPSVGAIEYVTAGSTLSIKVNGIIAANISKINATTFSNIQSINGVS